MHTISNQYIWNSLVFDPMQPFIPSLCIVFVPELTVKTCQIIPSTNPQQAAKQVASGSLVRLQEPFLAWSDRNTRLQARSTEAWPMNKKMATEAAEPMLVVVCFTTKLACADAGSELVDPEVTRFCLKEQEHILVGALALDMASLKLDMASR